MIKREHLFVPVEHCYKLDGFSNYNTFEEIHFIYFFS